MLTHSTFRETPEQYAQRRANETGRAYLVTGMGHAFMDCAMNRKVADDCGGIARRFKRQSRAAIIREA